MQEIKVWENVETERSASEAKRHSTENLRLSGNIIKRYTQPPRETPFALEYAYHLLGDASGKTVLDYGCGSGENCVLLAQNGAEAVGVDISPDLIELAEKRVSLHGFEDRVSFRVGSAHELPFEDETFDVVFGMSILHHLDLKLSSDEVFRVLKKGGRAIFHEPVRNSKLVGFIRGLIPYQEPDISPFERPLTDRELSDYAGKFSEYHSRAFSLPFVNLIEVLGMSESLHHKAIKFDGKLLKSVSFLNYYATIRVVEMVK